MGPLAPLASDFPNLESLRSLACILRRLKAVMKIGQHWDLPQLSSPLASRPIEAENIGFATVPFQVEVLVLSSSPAPTLYLPPSSGTMISLSLAHLSHPPIKNFVMPCQFNHGSSPNLFLNI